MALAHSALAASDSWTPVALIHGYYNFSVYGTFGGTITLQRSYDKGTTWLDVDTTSVPVEAVLYGPETLMYRAGFKAGAYSSGTAHVRVRGE